MMSILYRQCILEMGNARITCWLEASKVRVGIKITLKDSENPTQWWKVVSVSGVELPRKDIKGSHNSYSWHEKDFHGRFKGLGVVV